MKKNRILWLIVSLVLTIGPIIGLFQQKDKIDFDYYMFWCWIIAVWSGFGFGCACDNISVRKGYYGNFLWGFLFGFFGFLYWALTPAAWDHPEYMESDLRKPKAVRKTGTENRSVYRSAMPRDYSNRERRQ